MPVAYPTVSVSRHVSVPNSSVFFFVLDILHSVLMLTVFVFQALLITETILKANADANANDGQTDKRADIVHYISLFFPTYS